MPEGKPENYLDFCLKMNKMKNIQTCEGVKYHPGMIFNAKSMIFSVL